MNADKSKRGTPCSEPSPESAALGEVRLTSEEIVALDTSVDDLLELCKMVNDHRQFKGFMFVKVFPGLSYDQIQWKLSSALDLRTLEGGHQSKKLHTDVQNHLENLGHKNKELFRQQDCKGCPHRIANDTHAPPSGFEGEQLGMITRPIGRLFRLTRRQQPPYNIAIRVEKTDFRHVTRLQPSLASAFEPSRAA